MYEGTPVSYTHLDVYKRQAQRCNIFSACVSVTLHQDVLGTRHAFVRIRPMVMISVLNQWNVLLAVVNINLDPAIAPLISNR